MNNGIKFIALLLMSFVVGGCSHAIDKTLSPPSDTKWVNFEVKNPSQYTKPFPLEVRYISNDCQKKRVSGFDGSVISEPSYNVAKIPLEQREGNIWKAKVAMSGGGACKWTLSAVNLGIEYIDAAHLGKELVPGTAVGATIAFDADAARNGQFTHRDGNLILSPNYYPYIIEWNLIRHKKELTLLGKEDFMSLWVSDAHNISFQPTLDESKVVRFVEPEKKVAGVYSKIIYPDGSIAPEKTLFPSFDTVDKMKVK